MSSPPSGLPSRSHRDSTRSNSDIEDYFTGAKRRVLLSVDCSESSSRAFEWYSNNFAKEGDGLLLVHVVEPVSTGINYGLVTKPALLTEDFNKHLQELVDEGRKLGKTYLQKCKGTGIQARFILHIGAKPGEHICHLAKELQIDSIVMGSRGIGKIRRTLLGSVTDYVIHHAGRPVVVIPPPKRDTVDAHANEASGDTPRKQSAA
ncbi:unnamed protein product [Mesocestoides corti]|uniref:Usp domain-containing protein n=1 Tax=Mesocestoides corti TaxID=53468 RepID=A0A0R3U4W3_MESCO|nr:unnamed protein product [Mesocestoides corti]